MRLGFDSVREHNYDLPWLTGKPRWWTVTRGGARLEVVRVDFTQRGPELLVWVILPVGAMVCPALVSVSVKSGDVGLNHITNDLKGTCFTIDSDMGRALELRLVGMA